MKSSLIILTITLFSYNQEISTIRELYLSAYTNESNCDKFGNKLRSIKETTPLLKGYLACFYFIKCKFINNPITKISYFKKGKDLLEVAIKEDPESVELIFLRYSIQNNLPKFLSYNNIEKDFIFVNKNMTKISDKKTKNFISKCIKSIKE